MGSHRRLPSFGTVFSPSPDRSTSRNVWPPPLSEAYIVSRAGMTHFTNDLSNFIVEQCRLYIPPASNWTRPELILLGDSSPYDVAVVDGDAIPGLPGIDKPSERRDCLLRAIQTDSESVSRQLNNLRRAVPALRVIKGVVQRTICSMGDKVAPELTRAEAEADFVVYRVMHESGATEIQFVLMPIYNTLWRRGCACLGNISLVTAWSNHPDWVITRGASTTSGPARKKAVKGPGMLLRGNPCCPIHSLNPFTAAESRPADGGRHVMKRIPNDPSSHQRRGEEHPDRYISIIYETADYRITSEQMKDAMTRTNVIAASVPLHAKWPSIDSAALHPFLTQHGETLVALLLDEERRVGREQYALIGLEKASGNMWQPIPVKGSATDHERWI